MKHTRRETLEPKRRSSRLPTEPGKKRRRKHGRVARFAVPFCSSLCSDSRRKPSFSPPRRRRLREDRLSVNPRDVVSPRLAPTKHEELELTLQQQPKVLSDDEEFSGSAEGEGDVPGAHATHVDHPAPSTSFSDVDVALKTIRDEIDALKSENTHLQHNVVNLQRQVAENRFRITALLLQTFV